MNTPLAALTVSPAGPIHGRVAAPASKSVTNRLLVLAALADGDSELLSPLDSDDATAMIGAVEALGAHVDRGDGSWRVRGTGGRLRGGVCVDAALSGTTLRFAIAAATLADAPVTITGAAPLRRRPVGPLVAALRALGGRVTDDNGRPPVLVEGGGLHGGEVTVDVSTSSQYASAVLMAAPYARRDVTAHLRGDAAWDYIELTARLMRQWGAEVSPAAGAWRVTAGRRYTPQRTAVPPDASAAAHLYAFAVATGGQVTVTNAAQATSQPDAGIRTVMQAMGARVRRDGDAVTVAGPADVRPVDVDLVAMPDQVTTVAALAALADGVSTITGVAVARLHETDRLDALAAELGKLGVRVDTGPGALTVYGGNARGPARLQTHDDHRLAMAFAAVAARVPGVTVADPGCVTKTYPAFWSDARGLGVQWHEEPA